MSKKIQFEEIFEDTLKCYIFSSAKHVVLDDSYWMNLCTSVNDAVNTFSNGYLWHKDEFKVMLPLTEFTDLPPHLMSTTCFGDNIEDEWFIIFILFEITKLHKDLIIQVVDNDGDFLLIEAADFLPKWANPDTTINRVFICNDGLHLIPPDIVEVNTELKLKDSIKYIEENKNKTVASKEIQQCIFERIKDYSGNIHKNIHNAIVHIPVDIAALLKIKPTLISALVDAYCHHDLIDERLFKNINIQNCIPVKVKFTKFMYATLVNSKPRKLPKDFHVNDKKSIIGYNLMCGYHLILSRIFNNDNSDLYSSKQFTKYLENLKKNRYFKDNIEGSQEYNHLLKLAKEHFLNTDCSKYMAVEYDIKKILASKEFTEVKDDFTKCKVLEEEDSDDWLNVLPEQLDEELRKRYGRPKNNVNETSTHLSNFLKDMSSYEGIELTTEDEPVENNKLEFDCEDFVNSINKMLNLISTENIQEYDSTDDQISDESNDESGLSLEEKKTDYRNILQSIKEEGMTGPTSTLLRNIGINKLDLLDSDDE